MSSNSKKRNYKKISDELENREKECNDIAIYEYNRPEKNPYEYEDLDSFKKENPFDTKKNCKLLLTDSADEITRDKYNRYYKNVYTPTRCRKVNGFWVGSTVNRNNNYDNGNCWIDKEDAECGDLLNDYKLLRKKDYEENNVSREDIKKARNKCQINPKCYFKRISEFKRDCVSKNRINLNKSSKKNSSSIKKSNSNEKILLDMDNIEKSLQEFYSGKNAPETSELIGKGNRCVENYIESSITSSNKSKKIEEPEIDIIDENIESKIDYVNDLVKLEHIDENLSLQEFKNKYYDNFNEYIRFLIINIDPNKEENKKILLSYVADSDSKEVIDNFCDEYNSYIKKYKKSLTSDYKTKSKSDEPQLFLYYQESNKKSSDSSSSIDEADKKYYRNAAMLYHKYFPIYFTSYDDSTSKYLKLIQLLFIRFLIFNSNPNNKTDEKLLSLYIEDDLNIDEYKKLYNNNEEIDYRKFFSKFFNDKIDIYIEKIKKQYYIYSRFIISRTDPNDKSKKSLLLYFMNDINLYDDFIIEYNEYHKKDADPFEYYSLYNKYFPDYYQYELTSDFIYYVKNKIQILEPNLNEDLKELEKYISNPKLINEFKTNYNLIPPNSNYDVELQKLYKKYFPDYFGNIEKKYKSLSSSSSFVSSVSTPSIISSVSSSSSILKPPKLPTVPQSIINNICKIIHQNKLNKRGMLIWHSTGSGKTCTATSIMDGFWETDMDIIYCSKIEALTSNPPTTFYKCATDLFPRFVGKTIPQMEKEFSKKVRFLSFAKLANRINNKTIDLNNCILIIDEVHNLFRPLPNQKKQHEYLEKLLLNEKKFPKLKVFILTATLGDNPSEIIKLLNIVKNNDVEKIEYDDISKVDVFKEKIRGLISYFDMSSDSSKFPKVMDNEPKYINMSIKQFEQYIQKYKEVKESHKNYDKLAEANSLHKYWMAARKYSNMLYKFEKGITSLTDFSPKLEALLLNVLNYTNEKQYIYSAFYENKGYGGQGILAVALELKKRGYEQLTPDEAKKIYDNPTESDKKKRFILAITTQLGVDKGKELSEMTKLYNAPFNKNGEYVHLFLASQSYNEGLDLKAVRHIHIFEPLITWASDRQTIGRAARNCSHSDLRLKDWTVNIHRYISDFPKEIVQDEGKLQELKKILKEKTELLENLALPLKDIQTSIKNAKASKTKLNKDKKGSPERNKEKLQRIEDNILQYESKLEEIKSNIAEIKDEIKTIKKELKSFDDPQEEPKGKTKGKKKGLKLDATNIENIDKFIYKQAIDKMKEILTLYQIMQESAVDCLVLHKFHKNGNKNIECTKY